MSGQKTMNDLDRVIEHARERARKAKKGFVPLTPDEEYLLRRIWMSNGGSFDLRDVKAAKTAQSLVKRKLIAMEEHETRDHKGWFRLKIHGPI